MEDKQINRVNSLHRTVHNVTTVGPALMTLRNSRLWAVVRSGDQTRSNLRPFLRCVIVSAAGIIIRPLGARCVTTYQAIHNRQCN